MWVQQSAFVRCKCGAGAEFDLHAKNLKYRIYFFGDDAGRDVGSHNYQSYSLLGGSLKAIDDMRTAVQNIKSTYVPGRDPSSWRIHTKDIVNGYSRVAHPVYREIAADRVIPFFSDCADIIAKGAEYGWHSHISGFYKVPKLKKERRRVERVVKETMHLALLSFCIYRATENECYTIFTFDATKPVKKYPHIEGWSQNSYLGSQLYLAHAFLTHSNNIPHPKFVEPGSDPLLELADVHAFFSANDIWKRVKGERSEIHPERFGKVKYLVVTDGNHMEQVETCGLPDRFIPGLVRK